MCRNVLIVLALTLAGCTANTQPAYSCSTTRGSCIDFISGYTLEEASRSCPSGLSATPCPTSPRIGRCELVNTNGYAFTQSYYSPIYDDASAQMACGSIASSLMTGWSFSYVRN